MRKIALAVCVLMMTFVIGAQADTITFVPPNSPAVGSWGTASQTVGNIEIHGYYYNGSKLVDAVLFGRNQANDHGVGICSPAETTSCGTGSGGGDYNEVSDENNLLEIIRLTLPDGYSWDSVQVSSLDKNSSTDSSKFERGQLFGSSFGDPNVAGVAGNNTLLCNFVTGGAANNFCTVGTGFEPVLDLTGHQNDKYLYFLAHDWSGGTNTNNDYLVYGASITQTPEPGSLLLLGSGMLGLAGMLRRKLQA